MRSNRRRFLKSVGTAGVLVTAGCQGNGGSGGDGGSGGSDSYEITFGTSASGSSTMAAAQALARVADEESDIVTIDPQTSDGFYANMYGLEEGTYEAIGTGPLMIQLARNDEVRFADREVDVLPQQGNMWSRIDNFMMAVDGSGLESIADLKEGGYNLYPLQPGFVLRTLARGLFEEYGIWEPNNLVNVEVPDAPGALEEGRIDAFVAYGTAPTQLTGWASEIDVRSDVHLLEIDDEFENVIENDAKAPFNEYEPWGWENTDVTEFTDTVISWAFVGTWGYHEDVQAEPVEEICRLYFEHGDAIRESDKGLPDMTDMSNWSNVIVPDHPIHPGMANFLEEQDAWNDDWIRG